MTTWIKDDHGNRASIESWGDEAAARASLATLKGCKDCTDCKDCARCTGCQDCAGCKDCTDCVDCVGCTDCTDCRDCTDCTDCAGCKDCVRCTGCMDCTGLTGAKGLTGKSESMETANQVLKRLKSLEGKFQGEEPGEKGILIPREWMTVEPKDGKLLRKIQLDDDGDTLVIPNETWERIRTLIGTAVTRGTDQAATFPAEGGNWEVEVVNGMIHIETWNNEDEIVFKAKIGDFMVALQP
jgi:hypothetical protein